MGLGTPRPRALDPSERLLLPVQQEGEAIRRLFWSIWLARLANADLPHISVDDEHLEHLPLPLSEDAYLSDRSEQPPSPSTLHSFENGPTPSDELSPAAHLLGALPIWSAFCFDDRRWLTSVGTRSEISSIYGSEHPPNVGSTTCLLSIAVSHVGSRGCLLRCSILSEIFMSSWSSIHNRCMSCFTLYTISVVWYCIHL